jgi:hypothetical protein
MGNWVNKKPKFKNECLLLVVSFHGDERYYNAYWIKKEEFDGKWYWGCFTIDGDEWGDLNDLTADLYKTVNIPNKK